MEDGRTTEGEHTIGDLQRAAQSGVSASIFNAALCNLQNYEINGANRAPGGISRGLISFGVANVRNGSKHVILTVRRSLPVFPDKQHFQTPTVCLKGADFVAEVCCR
jgi:hypothetical protein